MKVWLVNCVPLSVMILLGIPKRQTIDLKNLTADCAVIFFRLIVCRFGIHFRPLCELVDGDVQVLKAPDSSGKRAEDIEPPDRKWPG